MITEYNSLSCYFLQPTKTNNTSCNVQPGFFCCNTMSAHARCENNQLKYIGLIEIYTYKSLSQRFFTFICFLFFVCLDLRGLPIAVKRYLLIGLFFCEWPITNSIWFSPRSKIQYVSFHVTQIFQIFGLYFSSNFLLSLVVSFCRHKLLTLS